ncbi:unnamed protein product [Effrenium voratum]|uniref:Uncharacterized protein n=2 Tax=Effrenium voratum TaxID=2562239 RepID=A0AA36IMB3_9DINO|nr:unnamed protein product [Effrenium voratum]
MKRRHQVRIKTWMALVFVLVKLMGAFVPPPQVASARLRGLIERPQFIGSSIVKEDLRPRSTHCRALDVRVWQVIVSASGLVVATTQAVRAFKASSEGKIRAAVAKAMKPFEPSRPQDEVIQRPVMGTIQKRVECWRQHATIIHGRYQSGKSVATEEALRGVRGVVRFSIESADWKRMMFEELKVENSGLFKEMMRRVGEKLKDFPDNLTKYPVLLLDIPRTTIEGIDRVSSTAKDVATDKIGCAIHVIVSASSAAVALAFDAGGTERQEDIWVADLTEEETKEFLALHGHEKNWKDFVDACGLRIGDLVKACENLKKGMSLDDTKQECQRVADDEVRGFMELQVHPKVTGREMLKELLTAYPAGILNVVNGIRILPRELAALIRNNSCHAVYFHPIKKRFFFASKLHKEAAEAQLAKP